MESFGLLLGHMLGDYVLQNDWQAKNKVNPYPGKQPAESWGKDSCEQRRLLNPAELALYWSNVSAWRRGHFACTVHCLLYTLAVWACSFWWMPYWGLAVCFVAHWPVDRFRLARWWMVNVSGQKDFATGPLAPWSVIVVDNSIHLAVLFVIGLAARGV